MRGSFSVLRIRKEAHMALKEYRWRGNTWQFDEADAPADAVPVEAPKPKAAKPAGNKRAASAANKARTPRAKRTKEV